MPKAKKKKVQEEGNSTKNPKQITKKIVKTPKTTQKTNKLQKTQKTKTPIPPDRSFLLPIIIIIIIMVLLIALFVLGVMIYYDSLGVPVQIASGENVGEATYTKDSAKIRLSDDVNLNRAKTVELVFSDGENQYIYSALDVGQEYEITPSDLGLETFDNIISVSATIQYEEPETTEEEQTPTTPTGTTTPITITPTSGGTSGGGGGGGGDDSCTDQCASEGLFCEGNQVYNCTKIVGGCLEKQHIINCLQGYECQNAECVLAQCTEHDNCTIDGCYSGEYRNYYCNDSTGYCDYTEITKIENLTNNNCNNALDDDCDTLIDSDDSGCQGIQGCGNNILETNETCDGTALNSTTCQDFGYEYGILGCCPDCLNFALSSCYNRTYGVCYDWDNGLDYETPSNATQAVNNEYGPLCPNTTAGGGGGGGGSPLTIDHCTTDTILTEYFCNSTTDRIDSITYDCALINKTCELGACVGAGTCGNNYCEGGSQILIHEGGNTTILFNGKTYSVSLIQVISYTLADIMVDKNTQTIEEGEMYTVENLPINVTDITYPQSLNKTGNVTLFLGENEETCPVDCNVQCTDECLQEGIFCEGEDRFYNCSRGFDGCLHKVSGATCPSYSVCVDWIGCVQCIPNCTDKECGDDGCGGVCGVCTAGSDCLSGTCVSLDVCEDNPFQIGEGDHCDGNTLVEQVCDIIQFINVTIAPVIREVEVNGTWVNMTYWEEVNVTYNESIINETFINCQDYNMTCWNGACVEPLPSMSLMGNLKRLWDLLFGWI